VPDEGQSDAFAGPIGHCVAGESGPLSQAAHHEVRRAAKDAVAPAQLRNVAAKEGESLAVVVEFCPTEHRWLECVRADDDAQEHRSQHEAA